MKDHLLHRATESISVCKVHRQGAGQLEQAAPKLRSKLSLCSIVYATRFLHGVNCVEGEQEALSSPVLHLIN